MNASKALSQGQRPGGQAVPVKGDHHSLLLLKATPSFSAWLPGGASGLGPQSRVWRWHLRQPGRFRSPQAPKPDRNKAKQTQRGHRTRPDPPANRPFLTQHTTVPVRKAGSWEPRAERPCELHWGQAEDATWSSLDRSSPTPHRPKMD